MPDCVRQDETTASDGQRRGMSGRIEHTGRSFLDSTYNAFLFVVD
ncbi:MULTISPECIES: hypothetical protein [Kribbella]|nr:MULTISPECIES: hypothetical protein [Kribbella]